MLHSHRPTVCTLYIRTDFMQTRLRPTTLTFARGFCTTEKRESANIMIVSTMRYWMEECCNINCNRVNELLTRQATFLKTLLHCCSHGKKVNLALDTHSTCSSKSYSSLNLQIQRSGIVIMGLFGTRFLIWANEHVNTLDPSIITAYFILYGNFRYGDGAEIWQVL